MSTPNLKGVNEAGIDKMVLDLYNYVERINNCLKNIDILITGTAEYYKAGSGNKLRNRFNLTRDSFSLIHHNLISYTDDLIKTKIIIRDFNEDLAKRIRSSINDIDHS